jgi:LysR family transcriptional activator of nhaA
MNILESLNYKHLHYFWVVAKSGGVAKAGEQLHVTPQSISGQIRLLEAAIGGPLWRRAGRKLELTDTGHLVLDFADRLFAMGEQLKDALRDRQGGQSGTFRVGVSGAVVKIVAHKLIAPALDVPDAPRLECREGRFTDLLALLAVHKLDLVLSDRPMHSSMNVRGYNHLLEECGVTFLAVKSLATALRRGFPQSLDQAPMLLPGEDSAVRARLLRWFDGLNLRPRVIGDFDDTAVMKAFGSAGSGVFVMPTSVAEQTAEQFRLAVVGQTDDILYKTFAISGERRIRHPGVAAICAAAPAPAAKA